MEAILLGLVGSSPAAVAAITVTILFLRYMREERQSWHAAWTAAIDHNTAAMTTALDNNTAAMTAQVAAMTSQAESMREQAKAISQLNVAVDRLERSDDKREAK